MKPIKRALSPKTIDNIATQMTIAQRKAHGRGYDLGFTKGFRIGGLLGVGTASVLALVLNALVRFFA